MTTGKPRQAVIVVHGVGEQRPMDTLRSFVNAMLGGDSAGASQSEPRFYSNPDRISDTLELRKLTTRDARSRTDFFELYWAHRMPVATWSRIMEWLRVLVFRSRRNVPAKFRSLWVLSWILLIAFGIACIASLIGCVWGPTCQDLAWNPAKLPILLGLSVLGLQALFLSYIGDAAIYLSTHPRNIHARQLIRNAGVEFLEKLHSSNKYDRIIVVGHSLGSVIGYDVLYHAWQRYHEQHNYPDSPVRDSLRVSEELAATLAAPTQDAWTAATLRLWMEQHRGGCPWLVTDFITLGSPLAHADLLLAKDQAEFARKVQERELPTCPPVLEHGRAFSYQVRYESRSGHPRSIFVPHQAACFALTRWTNFYFPSRWLLFGDVIGGPVAPLFGLGIRDVSLATRIRGGWLTHTCYWRSDRRESGASSSPIEQLRDSLDLTRRRWPRPSVVESN